MFVKLHKAFVRPILEFANTIWTPVLQRDIWLLESIQVKATRIPLGRMRPRYIERLLKLNLPNLAPRLIRGDLIITFQAVVCILL